MRILDLTPNDSRKSFYGKAKVVIDDNGQKNFVFLRYGNYEKKS